MKMNEQRSGLYADTITFFHKLGEVDGKAVYKRAVIERVKASIKKEYQGRDLINKSKATLYIPLSRLALLEDGFSISAGDLFVLGESNEDYPTKAAFRTASVEFFDYGYRKLRHIKVVGY